MLHTLIQSCSAQSNAARQCFLVTIVFIETASTTQMQEVSRIDNLHTILQRAKLCTATYKCIASHCSKTSLLQDNAVPQSQAVACSAAE